MNRNRILAVLTAGAVVSTGLAAFALHQRAEEGAQNFTPSQFFPGFAAELKNAARIHIVSHGADFNISNTPAKGWVLPGSGNYPSTGPIYGGGHPSGGPIVPPQGGTDVPEDEYQPPPPPETITSQYIVSVWDPKTMTWTTKSYPPPAG